MAWIYLIGKMDLKNRFKIGVTKGREIEERLKKLQTGNDDELYICKSFETSTPFKLEGVLHRYYAGNRVINEWFELSDDEVREFVGVCEKNQKIIDSLAENPFFKPT